MSNRTGFLKGCGWFIPAVAFFLILPSFASGKPAGQIYIPAGIAIFGSDHTQKKFAYKIGGDYARRGRWFDSEVERKLFVDSFFIDKFPVTQSEYYGFVKATAHRQPEISRKDYQRQGFLVHSYKEVIPFLWKGGKPPAGKLNHPVVLVSVEDAESYCRWRGKNSHLPTELEWEKAARGSNGSYFPWGNEWDASKANTASSGAASTTDVGSYKNSGSPYGVGEMAGNIFEWTSTKALGSSNRHILKSCSWDDKAGFCRGAARHSRGMGSRHILIGFRCATTLAK